MNSQTKPHPSLLPSPTKNGHGMVDGEAHQSAEMLIRWSQRWNKSKDEIAEFAADVQEVFGQHDSAEETRNKVGVLLDLQSRAAVAKHLYIKQGGDWFMADRCMYLLMGMHTAAGVDCLNGLVKLAEQRGFGKAAVNKCLQHFQKQVHELPILPGQREMESRLKMKNSRKKQL